MPTYKSVAKNVVKKLPRVLKAVPGAVKTGLKQDKRIVKDCIHESLEKFVRGTQKVIRKFK